MEEIEAKVRADLEKKFEEQERKIAKNTDLSRKSEVLFNNAEVLIAKQKNETANMLGTVYSNIIGVVKEVDFEVVKEVVFEVVIKAKAGVKIKPGPHFGRAPSSLIPDIVIL